jgi:hypothetical protein
MFDDSGVSLSSSDPNPSLDQYDDGGDSSDFSSTVSSAASWGTEITKLISGVASSSAVAARGRAPLPPVAMQSSTKLLMVGLGVAAAVAVIYLVAN